MSIHESDRSFCPVCAEIPEDDASFDRRQFLRGIGGAAAAIAGAGGVLPAGRLPAWPS